MNKDLNLLIKT